MRHPYMLAAALTLLAACGQSADSEAILETVRMTEQAQFEAIMSKDLAGAVRVYDADAVMVAPGSAPAIGASAIRAVFEDLLADPNLAIQATPGTGWASTSGQLAVTTFTAEFTTTDTASGKAITVPMENQTVWRKVDGGPWTISLDVNVAPATAAQTADPGPSDQK